MSSVLLATDPRDAIVTLTLNEPATLNAIGAKMAGELREAVRQITDQAAQIRCLVITGAGRGFCAGGSVAMMAGDGDTGGDSGQEERISLGTHHHHVLRLLRHLPFPIITAVNGPAAGLGFSYALAGDLVVAAQSAYFLAAFRNVGVSPDGGLSWTLPRLVGWARAKELLLLGKRLSAAEALAWGLVNRVFDDVSFRAETQALARELANGPTTALGAIRRLAWDAWELGFDELLDEEERRQLETFATEDAREGARAMLAKRKPDFRGR